MNMAALGANVYQPAAGGAAGAAGAAAAGGPWAMLAAAAMQKLKQWKAIPGKALRAGLGLAKPLANPTGISPQSVELVEQGIVKLSGRLGPVVDAFFKVGNAAFELAENFIARGRQIQQFSVDLTRANLQAEVRSMMGDVKEAQTLGPSLARLTDAESELRDEFRNLMLPIREVAVNVLVVFLEWLKTALEEGWGIVRGIGVTISDVSEALGQAFQREFSKAAAILARIPADVAEEYKKARRQLKGEDMDMNTLLQRWFEIERPKNPELELKQRHMPALQF
jgi:hypothetical protein